MLPLVQIPALGCDGRLYAPFNDALGLKAKTIVPVANSMAGCVEQVLAQAPREFILMGTSFGGRVALETTLTAPQRVNALIVIGAGPGPTLNPEEGVRRAARARGGEFEQLLKEMGDIISHLPGPCGNQTMNAFIAMGRAMRPESFATQAESLVGRLDLWPRMKEIACPLLCLWGEFDQYTPADVGKKMAAAVRHGSCVVLKDCGHFPTLEYPEEAAKAVKDWLAEKAG